jgi:ATP-dependent exoDNAse (exonuclease V) beta subunit
MVRYGPDLFGNPKTRISTIHKAKGLEADKVGILTNISRTAYMRCVKNPALWNEECNLMYVAMTRAKKGVLCMRKGDTEKSEGFNMPGVIGA